MAKRQHVNTLTSRNGEWQSIRQAGGSFLAVPFFRRKLHHLCSLLTFSFWFRARAARWAAVLLLSPGTSWAGGVVANCTETDLRTAMAGGGKVTFACDGTVALANTLTVAVDTVFDATGRQITLSGGDAVRVFYVAGNATLVVNQLTIAHGRSTNGAGILNDYGTVNATNTTFSSNAVFGASNAYGPGESVRGGAVANSGGLNLVNCSFNGNAAVGGAATSGYGVYGAPGGAGSGGAIWNSGRLTALACTLAANAATGGQGGEGAPSSPFPGAQGGVGGDGGAGPGGALFNNGAACLVNCTWALNRGSGGNGGPGGPSYPSPGHPNPAPGPSGSPGLGVGAICAASGQCWLTNCTVAFNSGTGASSSAGSSSSGGICSLGAALVNTLLAENSPGGNGSGALTDLGHNLSSDTTCGFTDTGSLNNTYAYIGPLTNHGGPTATIALLPGSPAINAANTGSAPSTDQRGVARPFGTAADIGAYEYNSSEGPPTGLVTECTEAALRAAMAGGGTVRFACDGVIALADTIAVTTNTVLDAAGHHISITAGAGVPAFSTGLQSPGVNFTLANLTISNCAGIQIGANSSFTGTSCVFCGNYGPGGALRNEGDAQLAACLFAYNGASALAGQSVYGGAVQNSGTLRADLCLFVGNSVAGASGASGSGYGVPGGSGGTGAGGALYNSGTMTLCRSSCLSNSVLGGAGGNGYPGHHDDPGMDGGPGSAGGSGGSGQGGAIYNAGTLRVFSTTFAYNVGSGGNGGAGADGGISYGGPGNGGDAGSGGNGGNGVGAVFNSGSSALHLVNSTFAFNSGTAGAGGVGGNGGSGSISGGDAGSGGNGGSGFGGVGYLSAGGSTNVTFASNSGSGGNGGAAGTAGTGYQPGTPGTPGSSGLSAGGMRTTGGNLLNTLLSGNTPGGNASGSVTDLGHNLSSDGSCAFWNAGSMNNTAALLGPLANNGGPTLTMALLPGSPAIDAGGPAAALTADQRGFPRPAGARLDIGVCEFGSVMPTLVIVRAGGTALTITGTGNTGQLCRLQLSADLVHWVDGATNRLDSTGTIQYQENCSAGPRQFYRLVMP